MKRKFLPLLLAVVLVVAAAIVPALTLTASAAEMTGTISFDSTAQRVSQDSKSQVWSNDGIEFTNNKASSSSNVADYVNPVRLYAKSSVIISAPGNIIKIVVTATSGASYLVTSVGSEASMNGTEVTIEPTNSADTYTIASLTKQVKVSKIVVTYEVAGDTPTCVHANTTTVNTATCTEAGTTTVTCDDCGEVVRTAPTAALGHNYVDGTCDVCGAEKPVTPDYSGRYYIATIRSSGNYFWMTSDLGTAKTKRYQAVDSGLTKLPSSMTGVSGYVFVLEKNDDDTYSIYAEGVEGNNYLGWTSDNSGILVAESDALKFTVDVNKEDGTYNIHFAASDGERYLALNNNSGNNYFAWYKSGQKQDLTLVPVVEKEPVTEPTFKSSSISIGTDLSMNYYIVLPDGADASEYTVQFVFNGKTYTVALVADGDMYKATLADIGPQNYELTITANLLYNDESVLAAPEYSINASLTGYINGDYDDKTKALAQATLDYCAAAKAYVTKAEEGKAPVKINNVTVPFADKSIEGNANKVVASVGVQFDYVNRIYIKLNSEVNIEAYVQFGEGKKVLVSDGIAYSDAISALQCAQPVKITVYDAEDNVLAIVNYSVNAYAYTMYTKYANAKAEDLTEKQIDMFNLAVTLYNYGVAAENYNK